MMRALSIRQPWAFSIVQGTKRIENRGWDTRFRGSFLIHASKGLTRDELIGWADMIIGEDIQWPGLRNRNWHERDFERGGIVGMATLYDVVNDIGRVLPEQRPWFFGPYGFMLTDVVSTPLIPCKGALGFFTVPDDVEQTIRQRLAA